MVIKAVFDRIEDGNAILLSDEMGIEISIPVEKVEDHCSEGETVSLTLDQFGNVNKL